MVLCPARSRFAGKVIRSSEKGPWSLKWMLLLSEYEGLKPPTPLFREFTSSVKGLGLAVTPGTVARSVPFTLTTTWPLSSPAQPRYIAARESPAGVFARSKTIVPAHGWYTPSWLGR